MQLDPYFEPQVLNSFVLQKQAHYIGIFQKKFLQKIMCIYVGTFRKTKELSTCGLKHLPN